MNQRRFGRSGLRASTVGLGCNNFAVRMDLAQTRAVVHKALDLGITLFDTADNYGNGGGSETMLGQALGSRRQDVLIASKFGSSMNPPGLRGGSRSTVIAACEASLKRLNTDWIDLYQMHWPDPATPVEETLSALDDLVRQGKVRYIGSSNFAGWQVMAAHKTAQYHGLHHFIAAQNLYNLLRREAEREQIPAMNACGVGLLPYLPLASGLLTGKYRRDSIPAGTRLATPRPHEVAHRDNADWTLIERLEQYAGERGRTLLSLAFGWLLARTGVTSVIAGATSPEQVEQNVAAAEWMLSDDDLDHVDRLAARHD